ncbi:MAG: hypothetical protein NWS68_03740, partial [Erythrobacter sp.]|nr:hypothetical protein [Erythrobacter sp.]
MVAVLGLAALYPASGAIGNGTFEGVASCAGSTCHGRAEGNGAVVRQDEIATWQEPSSRSGAHSRAFAVLGGRRGQQIAASLGLGNAQAAPACLGCHATYAPPAQRGVATSAAACPGIVTLRLPLAATQRPSSKPSVTSRAAT